MSLRLVYINKIGKNWENEYIYEFLFSSDTENVDGEYWDAHPADNQPEPPSKDLVDRVGSLVTKIKFNVIQESGSFGFYDSVDGVIAIAWEDIQDYDEYPDNRLYFKFGESMSSIADKLYERDKVLNYTENYERKERKKGERHTT